MRASEIAVSGADVDEVRLVVVGLVDRRRRLLLPGTAGVAVAAGVALAQGPRRRHLRDAVDRVGHASVPWDPRWTARLRFSLAWRTAVLASPSSRCCQSTIAAIQASIWAATPATTPRSSASATPIPPM